MYHEKETFLYYQIAIYSCPLSVLITANPILIEQMYSIFFFKNTIATIYQQSIQIEEINSNIIFF